MGESHPSTSQICLTGLTGVHKHGVKYSYISYILLYFRPTFYILEGRKKVLYFVQLLYFLDFKEMSPIFLELCIPLSKKQLPQQFQIKFLLLRSKSIHSIACLVFNFIANQYFPSCLMIHLCDAGS